MVVYCTGEPLPVALLRLNLWACSPEHPEKAVHLSVMELIYFFVIKTKTPLYRCCNALEALASYLSVPNKVNSAHFENIFLSLVLELLSLPSHQPYWKFPTLSEAHARDTVSARDPS